MTELKKAIDQISKDRGIDRDLLVDTLEEAVRSSVIRKYGENLDVEVSYNDEQGEIEVYQFKVVVEDDDVADPAAEICLSDARAIDPNVVLEDEMGFKLTVENLGRIAAQSAKQVIIQRMRDAEQEIIYEEYKDRKGEIISGIIQRRDRTGWIINLGRTEALLPKEEQIPRERYKRGDRVQAYIIEVLPSGRGPQIIVSRTHGDYMKALFAREVPEVSDGTVKIVAVARDPGSRAKVAVISKDRDVDPVGACVGIRGSRIQNIVQELRGERIDIVVWNPEIATYAANALSPARVTRISVDEDEKALEVVVSDDQLNLAIGRKGQNVKLAAKLLGWKIDIFTESRFREVNASKKFLEQLASVAEIPVDNILAAGFESMEQLAEAPDAAIDAIAGMTPSKRDDLRAALKLMGATAAKPAEDDGDEALADDAQADDAQADDAPVDDAPVDDAQVDDAQADGDDTGPAEDAQAPQTPETDAH
ncbi:MAG: transcription termination factor NusA [Solidesulfovibrio sp. DCME]|uniref:transcription termination factor NusA n=1 Tax=Solidesulfovibrio sp. DCME TaxID=3447380 RepID=UPI003D0E2893